MNIKNFVFVHSVQLIDLLESRRALAGLNGHMYVLLGSMEKHEQLLAVSPHKDSVILASAQPNNIEGTKNYLQFTGWFALANNPLIDDDVDYVGLYEYDVEPKLGFDDCVRKGLANNSDLDILGFFTYPKNMMFFHRTDQYCQLITRYLEEYLKITVENFIRDMTPTFSSWMVTSNVVMRRQRFLEFMWSDYMRDLMKFLDNNKLSGHALERSISLYFMLNKWNAGVILDKLSHVGADSHDTQGHKERYDRSYGV